MWNKATKRVTKVTIWSQDLELAVGASCILVTKEWTTSSCCAVDVWLIEMWFTFLVTKGSLSSFLQASTPSFHVCSKLESPVLPQLWYQEAFGAQQLSLPNLSIIAHLGHIKLVTAADFVRVWTTVIHRKFDSVVNNETMWKSSQGSNKIGAITTPLERPSQARQAVSVPWQASTPSVHVCSLFALREPPHFLNQEPPAAQQLIWPVFWDMPHFGQVLVGVIVDPLCEMAVSLSHVNCDM